MLGRVFGQVTVQEAIEDVAARFKRSKLAYGHGTTDPLQEATWLVLSVTGLETWQASRPYDHLLGSKHHQRINRLASRRIDERVPLAYLLNESWLGGHRFYVDKRVIVPRSLLFELLSGDLQSILRTPVGAALDMCTGSGCLAVLLAHTFKDARVDAVDLSSAALRVAARNINQHCVQARVRTIQGNLFTALPSRKYDLIVSNPPYVGVASMKRLPQEYLHEPKMSLAGGADGLHLVSKIIKNAKRHLVPRGTLVCEVGHNRKAVERAFPKLPFLWMETSAGPDLVFMLEQEQLPD